MPVCKGELDAHSRADLRKTGVAANLKEQANDQYKQRNFRQAMGFYSQAIKEVGDKLSSETLAVLHCNRAACHLELRRPLLQRHGIRVFH